MDKHRTAKYVFFISAAEASRATPSTLYGSFAAVLDVA